MSSAKPSGAERRPYDELELAAAEWLADSPTLRPSTAEERLVERALLAAYVRRNPGNPTVLRVAGLA